MVGVFKQIAGLVQAALGDVLADGHIVFAGKEMGKIELVNIIVKLNGIVTNYENLSFAEIKRQIFEIKKNINFLLKELKGR